MAKKITKKSVKKSQPKQKVTNSKLKRKLEKRPNIPQVFPSIWRQPVLIAGIMFFATALYFMTFNYGYILDDQVFFSKNNYVTKGFAGIKDIFTTEAMAGYFGEQKDLITGARYRPLSQVSFAVEHQFFGLKPGLSHVINTLLYGLTGVLIFYISMLFWPGEEKRPWYRKIGFWAALIFIAHPVHTEVVANIKGRDEIMALLFSLLTLIMAFKAKKVLDYIGVALLFYLALLAKENSLTFLAVIPFSLFVFRKNNIERKEWISLFAALVFGAAIYLLQRYLVIGYFLSSGKEITELLNNPFIDMNGSEKFATIFFTLAKYVQLLIWPHPLSHDYYPYAIATRNWTDIVSILSLLAYSAASIFAAITIWKRNKLAYFIIMFVATLSIVSNIPFTVGTTMNERFIYMSSLAFVMFIPYLFIKHIQKNKDLWQKIGLGLMTLMVVLFSYLTIRRIPVWSNSLALNRSAVSAYPNSARSNLFMGTALFNESEAATDFEEKKRLLAESNTYILKSLEIHPIYGNGLKMKAGVAAKMYNMDRDIQKLFNVFTEVLVVKPGTRYVHEYLEYLTQRGNVNAELINYYYDLGFLELGQKRGQYQWAAKFLDYAYQLDPNNKRILNALAATYDNLGETNRANQYRSQIK
jgi:hypothetical protein